MYRLVFLRRYEYFIYRNRVVLTSCCFAPTPISFVARVLGLSPDTIVKRVRYCMCYDNDLPF